MISYLIQETVNKILTIIVEEKASLESGLRDNTLAKRFDVSRTSIRTAITLIQEKGILSLEGGHKVVLRAPQDDDFYDTSNTAASKEEVIEQYFLKLINRGELLPGEKFSELELAKGSGCNTITVREFLIKFSRFGLIEKKPRAKWQMVEFDEKFASELIEFRRILEMNSITKLLSRPSHDPVWSKLSDLLRRHNEVLADVDNRYREFSELDRSLHLIIQEASENRFFMQFFNVVSLICHYHYQWDRRDEYERNLTALHEHIDILTELLAHNTTGVIQALEVHLNTARKTLLNSAHGLTDKQRSA